jgi:hypothetical protein
MVSPQEGGPAQGKQRQMETIHPNNTDPIPLPISPPRIGTIMIRFAGLLFLSVTVLALLWSR